MSSSNEVDHSDHTGKIEIQIEQVQHMFKIIIGMIITVGIFTGGWVIKISEDVSTLKADLQTAMVLADISKTSITSMTETATMAFRLSTKIEEILKSIEFRIITLENEKGKGGRFTAEDGNRLVERIRILEDEIGRKKEKK